VRAALLQRAEDWRTTLRAEPHVARVLLRRLIGPLVLHDESEMPAFIRADAEVKPWLLDGIVPHEAYNRVLSREGSGRLREMYIRKWLPQHGLCRSGREKQQEKCLPPSGAGKAASRAGTGRFWYPVRNRLQLAA
jgi:hypothetical protein